MDWSFDPDTTIGIADIQNRFGNDFTDGVQQFKSFTRIKWIPACAGMTAYVPETPLSFPRRRESTIVLPKSRRNLFAIT
jgi:hypothetical protein